MSKKDKIIRLFSSGKSIHDITCLSNTTNAYCKKVLKCAGLYEKRQLNKENIIKKYISGESIVELSEKNKSCTRTISKILRSNNIKIRDFKEASLLKNMLPQEEEQKIIDLYLSGYSIHKISKYTKHARQTCSKILDSNNIIKRQYDNRTYKVNDDYFSIIDIPEKAYWLGMLAADGCVTSGSRNGIILSLKRDDKNHIFRFKGCVGAEAPVRDKYNYGSFSNKVSEMSEIRFYSKKMKIAKKIMEAGNGR